MKLTKRLNAAVDDLIKVGQKYKNRNDIVSTNIDKDRYSSIRNSDPSTLNEGTSLGQQKSKRNQKPSTVQSNTKDENSLTTMSLQNSKTLDHDTATP